MRNSIHSFNSLSLSHADHVGWSAGEDIFVEPLKRTQQGDAVNVRNTRRLSWMHQKAAEDHGCIFDNRPTVHRYMENIEEWELFETLHRLNFIYTLLYFTFSILIWNWIERFLTNTVFNVKLHCEFGLIHRTHIAIHFYSRHQRYDHILRRMLD